MLWRRLTAEFLGSAFLAAVVIGSGIAAQRLSPNKSIDANTDGNYEGDPYKGVEIHFNLAPHGCCERR
jgi:glycerol uptake facilitator-like aquaporin